MDVVVSQQLNQDGHETEQSKLSVITILILMSKKIALVYKNVLQLSSYLKNNP